MSYPCTQCHNPTICKDSRPNDHHHWRRRRECPNCNHRFTTYEIPETEIDDIQMKRTVMFCSEVTAALERYRNGGADHG